MQGLSCCHGKGVQSCFLGFRQYTITRPRLRLSLVLYFACSPRKWVITTTCTLAWYYHDATHYHECLPFTIMIVLKSLSPRPNQSCQLLCGVSFFSKLDLFLPIWPTSTTLLVQCPRHCQSHVESAKVLYLGHPLFAIHIDNLSGFVCPTQQHCCLSSINI